MTVYQYQCQDCKKKFELTGKGMTPPKKPACPRCGSNAVVRKWNTVALILNHKD